MSAIEELIRGYHRFRQGYYQENRDRLVSLAQGQSPAVAVVGCCDSRVDPAVITDSAPGDLFVIRNVANLVPPCEGQGIWHGTSAALEFAVRGLQVAHIVILGHARCGGIRALMEAETTADNYQYIGDWMRIAAPARERALELGAGRPMDEQARLCELEAIRVSLANLETFPWVRERLAAGTLSLHGWYYDLASGTLLALDRPSDRFEPV